MTVKTSLVRLFLSLAMLSILSSCIRPFQPPIQQGNILNNSELSEIRYGMSKQEVLFILGTPLINDPFNQARWDYYYSNLDRRNRQTRTRLVTVIFDGDNLVELTGDVDLATIQGLEPSTEDKQTGGTIITEPTQKEKGFLNRLLKRRKK